MKTWFIRGASRGFGALVAERALAKGDAVVATARNPNAIAERFGEHPNLLAVTLDVTVEDQAFAAAKAAIHRHERSSGNSREGRGSAVSQLLSGVADQEHGKYVE